MRPQRADLERPGLRVLTGSFPGAPTLDTAVSRALLLRVAKGSAGESLRLYRPDDVLAFSISDRRSPGFAAAVSLAREAGFAPVLRLAGGRAAVFHRETLAFSWSRPVADMRTGLCERFEVATDLLAEALRALGVDARIGEVPGEYCPGRFSINAAGRLKIVGVGQRIVRGAAHVGGVIVVADSRRVRDVLVPVYRALGYDFDPETTGCVAEAGGPAALGPVVRAVRSAFARRFELRDDAIDDETLGLAETLAPDHDPETNPRRVRGGLGDLRGGDKGVVEGFR